VFNIYCKIINMLSLMEYLPVADARDGVKKYFEAMSTDLNLASLENRKEDNIEEGKTSEANYNIGIKDIQWRFINLVSTTYTGTLATKSANADSKENVVDILEIILSKDRFFERSSLIFPLRFVIMGGSPELQMCIQNFGALFEVN